MSSLEATVLRPLRGASWRWWLWTAFLASVVAWAVYAYTVQLRHGLGVTGMGDVVPWGLYIVNFVFFIGISHAGTLISAILRVTQAEWRRPITRLAEAITVIALMVGGLMPLLDIGRPGRVLNLITDGSLRSPVLWDLLSITTYFCASALYLYLPLLPDIARCRDRLDGEVSWARSRLYRILAMGWHGSAEQQRRLDRATGIMMILIIPIAVSVHTVVSWIFSMTVRAGWDSTIFGPYFVVGAIFSGIAAIIVVMAIFRRLYGLQEWITEVHFRYLGYMLLTLGALYAYFTFAEYLTLGYKLPEGEGPLLEALLVGRYAVPFWAFAIGGIVVPIALIAWRPTRTVRWIVVASVLVLAGMWLKRFVIVIPSLAVPLLPYEWGTYRPTWVELSLTAGAFALFALLFTLFARVFPVISMWEVEEEPATAPEAEQPVAQPVEEPAWAFAGGGGAT